eukprot:1920216-Heterocapsa_arctica.AAC.2
MAIFWYCTSGRSSQNLRASRWKNMKIAIMARWPFTISGTNLTVFAVGAGDEHLEARVALGSR